MKNPLQENNNNAGDSGSNTNNGGGPATNMQQNSNTAQTVFEKILTKEYSLSVTVQKADAISNLIKMKLQYGFILIIYGAREAHVVVDEIKLSDTKVIFTDVGFTGNG